MDTLAQPHTCSLEGTERIDAWRQVAARATSSRVEHERVVATYPNDPQLRERLRELIALEGDCCSFLRFGLEERPDAIVTELRLPDGLGDEARAGIRELFGACSVAQLDRRHL
jgi:hypothetical protein